MADSKISALTALTSIASGDLIPVVDISDTTQAASGTTKKITQDNLIPDSSDTVKGKVELATTAETTTGTDATRAVTPDGLHDMTSLSGAAWFLDQDAMTDDSATKVPSQQSVKAYVDTKAVTEKADLTKYSNLYAPRGFMVNGKFTVTDSGSGIVIALKTLAGTDPSATDPVYIRIGDTVRSVTAALSRAIADGTNWGNAGSAELATKEIDWALYAIWDSNSSAVALSPSRIFHGNLVSDFSATTTDEKHLIGYSDYTTTDEVEVIGRFAATLSAGAGYTWSVPTYTASNLIQRPIYETRNLDFSSTIVGFSGTPTQNGGYKFIGGRMFFDLYISGTSNSASFTATLPFNINMPSTASQVHVCWVQDSGTASSGRSVISDGGASVTFGKVVTADGGFTASGSKGAYLQANASI